MNSALAVEGKNVIMEDLRQSCLHTQLKEEGREYLWWDYVKHVHSQCFEYIGEMCSKEGHREIKRNMDKTKSCVDQSFWKEDYASSENTILKANDERWKEYGTLYWPSVVINRVTYRGDITAENILEVVCAALADKPRVCLNFYKEEHIVYEPPAITAGGASVELLVVVVILLVTVNVLLICAYRRCQ